MSNAIVVAGTDTDIGKTVFSAALAAALQGAYWKPIQAGLAGETDSDTVRRLGGLAPDRIIPEMYRLHTPASPHYAAELDRTAIDVEKLAIPRTPYPLVIETAGGLAVPLTSQTLQIDVIARWKVPVVLCAATRLGTINHTLLSIEALKRRAIPILGVAFVGDAAPSSEQAIAQFGGVKSLGRLPHLDPLNAATLKTAFRQGFNVGQILGLGANGP